MDADRMWIENDTGIELVKAPPRKIQETEEQQDVDIGPLCVFPQEEKPTSENGVIYMHVDKGPDIIPAPEKSTFETAPQNYDDTVLAMIQRIAKDTTLDMPAKVAKLRESVPFAVEHPVVTLFHLFSGAKKGDVANG